MTDGIEAVVTATEEDILPFSPDAASSFEKADKEATRIINASEKKLVNLYSQFEKLCGKEIAYTSEKPFILHWGLVGWVRLLYSHQNDFSITITKRMCDYIIYVHGRADPTKHLVALQEAVALTVSPASPVRGWAKPSPEAVLTLFVGHEKRTRTITQETKPHWWSKPRTEELTEEYYPQDPSLYMIGQGYRTLRAQDASSTEHFRPYEFVFRIANYFYALNSDPTMANGFFYVDFFQQLPRVLRQAIAATPQK